MILNKYSTFKVIGVIILTAVITAMTIHAFISYQSAKNRFIEQTNYHSNKTLVSLNKNISIYIESYAVNEYTRLVLSEMDYEDFQAIIIHDYNMGQLLGQEAYVSGKIRGADKNIIDYDPENIKMNKSMKDCYLTFSSDIISASGIALGNIYLCTSGHTIENEQLHIIKQTLLTSVIISIILVLLLFSTIHRILLNPISKIVSSLSRTDKNGIPIDTINLQGTSEINKLSTSIADMITIIKESRDELEAKHGKLLHVEKLSSVGRFAASIAHEFNNPLCGIVNVLNGIKKRAKLSNNDQKLTFMALQECERMRNLIADLQQFTKPSYEERMLTNLNNSIEEILLFTKKEFKDKKISIKKNLAIDLPEIWVIPDQIKQVLINLIGNAEDAMENDGGGTISIVTAPSGSDSISISIIDSGEGITHENMEQIFEPFYTTKAIKGTGLGLSVSYGIIMSHNGKITVQSELSEGSTFTITLPIDTRSKDEK